MKQVPDRKKLRREYVESRIVALGATTVISVSFVFLLVATILICVLCTQAIEEWMHHHGPRWLILSYISAAIATMLGIMTFGCGLLVRHSVKATRISYVPPVTADILPADEILVRGSEEPTVAQSEMLLRAATRQETQKEELLRVAGQE